VKSPSLSPIGRVHVTIRRVDVLRPLEWAFRWLSERPIIEATARVCTENHMQIFFGRPGGRTLGSPPQPRHIDVNLLVRKTRGGKVTIYELASAHANHQAVKMRDDFEPIEIEGGATPVKRELTLSHFIWDQPVDAAPGDVLELEFRATHSKVPVRVTTQLGG
jgi:hypothetical protein